ncbi:hypothetical protein T492DRAFT_896037 [Pavlovales sp. CCMP2436]|nr:hypothetical protein T492DRAFT_896037 [Pavlovales sp. CCMP2436]
MADEHSSSNTSSEENKLELSSTLYSLSNRALKVKAKHGWVSLLSSLRRNTQNARFDAEISRREEDKMLKEQAEIRDKQSAEKSNLVRAARQTTAIATSYEPFAIPEQQITTDTISERADTHSDRAATPEPTLARADARALKDRCDQDGDLGGYGGGRDDLGGYSGGRGDLGGYGGRRDDLGGYSGGRGDLSGYDGGRGDQGSSAPGEMEITTKHGTVVLAESAIEEFFVANPTTKGRLKSLDKRCRGCTQHLPLMPFRVLLVRTATAAGLGKEQRDLLDKASKEAGGRSGLGGYSGGRGDLSGYGGGRGDFGGNGGGRGGLGGYSGGRGDLSGNGGGRSGLGGYSGGRSDLGGYGGRRGDLSGYNGGLGELGGYDDERGMGSYDIERQPSTSPQSSVKSTDERPITINDHTAFFFGERPAGNMALGADKHASTLDKRATTHESYVNSNVIKMALLINGTTEFSTTGKRSEITATFLHASIEAFNNDSYNAMLLAGIDVTAHENGPEDAPAHADGA